MSIQAPLGLDLTRLLLTLLVHRSYFPIMTRRGVSEELPEHLREAPASREDCRVRWVRDGWYWGPVCPVDEGHGALLDLKGSEKWYCRHQQHQGRGVYSEEDLLDIEWAKVSSSESAQ